MQGEPDVPNIIPDWSYVYCQRTVIIVLVRVNKYL